MMKERIAVIVLFLIVGIVIFPFCSSAKDIPFEIEIDRKTVSLGSTTELKIAFHGTKSIPAPTLPQINGLEIHYIGPSTVTSFVNGHMSRSITHMYTVIPLKVGAFNIGPFSFNYQGDTYLSKGVTIAVTDGSSPAKTFQTPQGSGTTQGDADRALDDYVFLTTEAGKKKAYLNEMIPLKIRLYINRFNIRDIQYPEFAHEGFSVEDFKKPSQYQQVVNGVRYEVVEFETNVFGTRPGVFKLGPAQLEGNLLLQKQSRKGRTSAFDDFFSDDFFNSFFGSYERRPLTVTSPEITMTILPLPEEGKPVEFKGTLGSYTFTLQAAPTEVKIGDPITLKMSIKGEGNLNTVLVPELASTEGFKVYEPQVRQESNGKYFEQIVLPTTDTVREIPKVTFSFFDTKKGCYETITRGSIPIQVKKLEGDEQMAIIDIPEARSKPFVQEVLGRDIIYIKESPGILKSKDRYLYTNTLYCIAHGFPPIVFISLLVFMRRKERLATDVRYARRLHAPKKAKKGIQKAEYLLMKGKQKEFYDTVFKTLQEYLGNKFHLASGGITIEVVDLILKEKNIAEDILTKLEDIFKECDMVRYAPSEFGKQKQEETFQAFKDIIDYLERRKF
ncbi:MAG: BatD family protein [Candidatus Omnitrophica bacterium]|nr:BatD family protein [Candidatus Omnitrophota bacterium]